jgi:hypothetical protein
LGVKVIRSHGGFQAEERSRVSDWNRSVGLG